MEQAIIPLTEKLWVYGPMGVMTAISVVVAVYMFNLLTKERKRFDAALKAQAEEHKKEMADLLERYVSKAETWMTKHFDLSTSYDATIKALKGLVDDVMRRS